MGRKNGCHVVEIKPLGVEPFGRLSLFMVKFKSHRCKYTKVRKTLLQAKDEMDAWHTIKRIAADWQ